MKCKTCGIEVSDNSLYCPNCGTQITRENQFSNSQGLNPEAAMNDFQKKKFFNSEYCNVPRRLVIAASIIMYVSSAITLVIAVLGNITLLLDMAILVTLGVLLQIFKSRVVSILVGVYAIINVIVMMVALHSFGGELLILAAVLAIVGTFMLHSKWNEYCASGYMPQLY